MISTPMTGGDGGLSEAKEGKRREPSAPEETEEQDEEEETFRLVSTAAVKGLLDSFIKPNTFL